MSEHCHNEYYVIYISTVPTISVPVDSVSVIEADNITITCTPSDDQVQLFWSLDPPGSLSINDIESQLSGDFEQSVVSFDSELKHSLTISDVFFAPFNVYDNEGTYYCYVRGDEFETIVQPGEIFVNVLTCELLCMHRDTCRGSLYRKAPLPIQMSI